ncbi:sensor histidine kinase [Yinghuangia sp. YIM S09857]|uniref:sensor histidine kinase n=1 Tax=Yinghuangia sp. YIM S09857 TaxID=3436929 RepID=UPI003F52B75A
MKGFHGRGVGRRSWTTRRWLMTSVMAALSVLLVLGALGAWVLHRASEVTDQLTERSSPALIASLRLEKALLDQETGIRGYALAGQLSYLEPYMRGIEEQESAVVELERVLHDDAAGRADLAAVLGATERWHADIARHVARTEPADMGPDMVERVESGKPQFDAVRAAAEVQQRHLEDALRAANRDLDEVAKRRNAIFVAIGMVIVVLAALVFEGLRRGVTLPLERLSADARTVSRGAFDHPIQASGPADLQQLALDVEGMRRRLLAELDFTLRARAKLDEQAEDLRRSNAELEQFAYVASHDLQEPLRKVASFCQLLQRRYAGQLDERADQYIEFAVDGANRMQALINDLLAFSRVGRTDGDHETVDLERTFGRVADTLSFAVEESGATVTHDPLPTLTANPTQMTTLFQNLLSNAVKFRDPEVPSHVHVSVAQSGEMWEFAVTDNGIGIEPEYAERVFVIFQRLHAKDAYPGTGIGLAMCKKIVEFHGGEIEVAPGHSPGARITFTLPVADAPDDALDDPADDTPGADPDRETEHKTDHETEHETEHENGAVPDHRADAENATGHTTADDRDGGRT